ncbi:MAG: ribosome-associated translation inhibitor RaiA, partial [Anaerolineales bacterium]|nr:ribosome-associated translation inhibitor RaiA [Anaerolineales bacterium]
MAVQVEIFSHNTEINDGVREYVNKKASKLDRYLSELENVRVELSYIKSARSASDRNVAQITARGRRALLRAEERAEDLLTAFDRALDKMQRQIERYKGKRAIGRGDGRSAADVVPHEEEIVEEPPVIVRRKKFDLVPMSEAEALEQMKLLGH